MTDIDTTDEIMQLRPITPRNWELLNIVAFSTPLPDPTGHPNDPQTIWGPAINSVGLSGGAKTERYKQLGKALGLPVWVVPTSTKQPASFEGVLVPTPDGIVVECVLQAARRCTEHGGGIIFFDEVNGATPRTQAALLHSLTSRQFGDHLVPPQTRMCMAMNPLEQATGAFALSAAMANRMGHVWYEPPSKEDWGAWLNGAQPKHKTLSQSVQLVKEKWTDKRREVNALMTGFISRSPTTTFMNQPEAEHPSASSSWPSYRTWYYAVCSMTAARCMDAGRDVEVDLVGAFCGAAAMTEWEVWLADASLPTPEEALASWEPNTRRPDVTLTVLQNTVSWLIALAEKDRPRASRLAEDMWKLLGRTFDAGTGDVVVPYAQMMYDAKLAREETPAATAEMARAVVLRLTKAGFSRLI